MSMKGLNLSKFKKLAEDKDWATMIHKDGHKIIIAKGPLPALQRRQLEELPYAEGGDIPRYAEGTGNVEKEQNKGITVGPEQDYPPQSIPQTQEVAQVSNQTPSKLEIEQIPEVVNPPTTQMAPQVPQNKIQAQESGFEAEKKAKLAGAEAVKQQGEAEAKAIQQTQDKIAALPTQNDVLARYAKGSKDLYNEYATGKINPDRYWENHSKTKAGIGVLISALGQAFGSQGGNQALQGIEQNIKDDIQRQKDSQDKQMNLFKMNRQLLGDDLSANLATQNQLWIGTKYDLEKAASQAKGPIALAQAQAEVAQIDQKIQANNLLLSQLNPTSNNPDPEVQVLLRNVPEGQRKEIFHEIAQAKEVVKIAPSLYESFDRAAKEARPLTGGPFASRNTLTPFATQAQKSLKTLLGPTFADKEGTINREALNQFVSLITPHFGDSDAEVAQKRKDLSDYLKSHTSGSVARGYGIDLSKFPSTHFENIGEVGSPGGKTPEVIEQDGFTYHLNKKTGKYE